ncbi:MAG: hypothetical protein MUP47_05550 [Phycisphaerae bacterium]|nr:hypothetical protein [Phycisphaerae bacterium]
MNAPRHSPCPTRKAFAYILALILLAMCASLAVVWAAGAGLSLKASSNYGNAAQARLAAEGGLTFLLRTMAPVRLPGTTDPSSFPGDLCSVLGTMLNSTPNLSGQTVTVTGAAVTVPQIVLPYGYFTSQLAWANPNRASLTVTGSSQDASRRVQILLDLVPRLPDVFDYGLASRGQIVLSGSAEIVGVNDPSEASVLSATTTGTAIALSGSAAISGDLYTTGSSATVAISGSPSVGGSYDPNVIAQHVHFDVAQPSFPEVDIAPLAALATNVLNTSSPSASTYSNIRIAANTNPTFGGDVVLNGVVYIEAPNIVTFAGQTTINGLIVTQDSDLPISSCQLSFSGSAQAYGVEVLPDTPEFAAVKQMTGTFVLAPGFAVTFSGNFGSVNGSIAADQLTFTGTAEGVVRGTVLGLADLPTTVSGHVEIYVDHAAADPHPAGFVLSIALVPVPSTYLEPRGAQ